MIPTILILLTFPHHVIVQPGLERVPLAQVRIQISLLHPANEHLLELFIRVVRLRISFLSRSKRPEVVQQMLQLRMLHVVGMLKYDVPLSL